MHVIATAGHVDHGKSTLVRALTGTDPDRLEEERRRGLTIQLGYAWTTLDGAGEVAFVDVPGHERFLTTTLAGMGPVPAVLFVVAADDPWMPQSAEHLAALDALGVRHGVLAITRSDLADPAPAMARAREEIARTSLADIPVVAVSAVTGLGMGRLRDELARLTGRLGSPDPEADVRLWVDRSFAIRGAGTVVTGTLPAGTVRTGDVLALGEHRLRVRGIECLERTTSQVSGTARVALNLGGRPPEELGRGSVLVTPEAWHHTELVDVALSALGPVPDRPLLHVGALSMTVHARPLDDAVVRLTLPVPLPLRIGDRAVLRDPGTRQLWGLSVLDPAPPPLRRRGAGALRAKVMAGADGSLASELDRRGVVRRSLLRRIGVDVTAVPDGVLAVDDWLVAPGQVAALRARLTERVEATMSAVDPGLPTGAAAHELGLPADEIVTALVAPPLETRGGRVRLAGAGGLPPRIVAAWAQVREDLGTEPFGAPDANRLAELGLDKRALAALERAGQLLRVDAAIVLLPGADREAERRLAALPQPFTTSEARQALGTSRRVALPLLAYLDRKGLTRRLPDDRRTTEA
jgi:selenocysteine-specific elongation factor